MVCTEIIGKVKKSMNFKTVKMAMARFHTPLTSHSAYVATETELVGAKIDGLLPPNVW